MSLSSEPLQLYLARDPAIDFTRKPAFGVADGASYTRWVPLATQNFSEQGITAVFQPNNPSTALSRDMKMRVQFKVQVTGTRGATGTMFNIGVYDSPSRAPLARTTAVLAVQINDSSVRLNTNWVADAFLRSNTDYAALNQDLSTFPATPDVWQQYQDAYSQSVSPVTNTLTVGQLKNPLVSAGEWPEGMQPRGGWQIDSIVNDAPGVPGSPVTLADNVYVTFTTSEPLYVSPLGAGAKFDDGLALLGVQTMQIDLTFIQNLELVWSHVPNDQNVFAPNGSIATYPATFATTTVTVLGATLLQKFLTLSAIEKIPDVITYPYAVTNVYTTIDTQFIQPRNGGLGLPIGNTLVLSSQTLAYIPRRMLIFLRPKDNFMKVTTPDAYARITRLNITFDSINGYYAGADPRQLYEVSRSNGYNESWDNWFNQNGSIFIAEFGRDLGLNNQAESVSVATNKQLQVEVTYEDIRPYVPVGGAPQPAVPIQYTCYMVLISDGVMNIGGNSAIQRISVLTPEDVIKAKMDDLAIPANYNVPTDYFGGKRSNFLHTLGKLAHSAQQFAKKSGIISHVATALGHPELAAAATSAGYGRVSKQHLQRK